MAGAFPGCESAPLACAYCGGIAGNAFWPMLHRKGRPGMWVYLGGAHIDHIFPWLHGGLSVLTNLAIACENCNESKGHKQLCAWRGIAP